jgi:hypothetical protein
LDKTGAASLKLASPVRSTALTPRTSTNTMSTTPQVRQRTTVPGRSPVDDKLSHRSNGAAGAAGADCGGHLGAENVDQQAADRVAVQCLHHGL